MCQSLRSGQQDRGMMGSEMSSGGTGEVLDGAGILFFSPSLFLCTFPRKGKWRAGVSTGDQVQLGCNLSRRPLVTRQIVPFICSWAVAQCCIFHLGPRMDLLARRNVTSLNALICHGSTVFSKITAPQTGQDRDRGEMKMSKQTVGWWLFTAKNDRLFSV